MNHQPSERKPGMKTTIEKLKLFCSEEDCIRISLYSENPSEEDINQISEIIGRIFAEITWSELSLAVRPNVCESALEYVKNIYNNIPKDSDIIKNFDIGYESVIKEHIDYHNISSGRSK